MKQRQGKVEPLKRDSQDMEVKLERKRKDEIEVREKCVRMLTYIEVG